MKLTLVYHRFSDFTTNMMQIETTVSELRTKSDEDLLEEWATHYRQNGHNVAYDIALVGVLKADTKQNITWFEREDWDAVQVTEQVDKPRMSIKRFIAGVLEKGG